MTLTPIFRSFTVGVAKWDVVLGGSWGVTLAMAYAQQFPERVAAMVLRGVCLMREGEIGWLFSPSGGAASLNPRGFAEFASKLSVRSPKTFGCCNKFVQRCVLTSELSQYRLCSRSYEELTIQSLGTLLFLCRCLCLAWSWSVSWFLSAHFYDHINGCLMRKYWFVACAGKNILQGAGMGKVWS